MHPHEFDMAVGLESCKHPQVRVLVLTTYGADEWVFDAIRSGATGCLLKDTPRERLIEAIRDTAAGKTPVDPNVAGKLFAQVAQGIAPSWTCPTARRRQYWHCNTVWQT